MTTFWSFEELSEKAMLRDPFEAEFFTGEEANEEVYGRTDALVRESIQNSMDAVVDNKVAKVRFSINSSTDIVDVSVARTYLDGLIPHLDVLGNEFVNMTAEIPPMSYLTVEDFNTHGLRGDPEFIDTMPPDDEQSYDFYWFWRNVGRSGKEGSSRGRWGLGKTVFPATSKINAIFALTVRSDDARHMLMGQAITKIHRLNEKRYVPEGFFCDPDKSSNLQMPFENRDLINNFCNTFKLKRDSEPGLSIVIPYPFDRIQPEELVKTVIVHYFYPILKGELIVEVSGPGFEEVELNAETIEIEATKLHWNGSPKEKKHVPPPFDLANWAIYCQRQGRMVVLKSPADTKTPFWGEHLFVKEQLVQVRNDYNKGERIAVRVPMTVIKKDSSEESTYFDIFVERDSETVRSNDHFVREGMTISKISTLSGQCGVKGLLVVEDKPLSSLLGDAEGPAHTEWGTGESRPDKKFKNWKHRIGFVRNGILKLIQLLSPPPEGLDEDWLQDIFSIISPEDDGSKKRRKRKRHKGTPPPPPPPPPPNPKGFSLIQCSDGFKIKCNDRNRVPHRISIQAAYDIPNGSPFRSYSPIDFKFEQKKGRAALQITHKKLSFEKKNGNTLIIVPKTAEFELQITGFDTNRDLIVRANVLEE